MLSNHYEPLKYFRNVPILHVLGRQHPVNIRHVTKSQDDWQSAILATVFQIHGQGKIFTPNDVHCAQIWYFCSSVKKN